MGYSIIGISGKMGAGKSTIALHLHKMYNYHIVSFADSLRNYCREHGIEETRENLQRIGIEKREIDADYWVKLTKDVVDEYLASGKMMVIDDVRFPNEAQMLLDVGALVVRLDVDRDVREYRLKKAKSVKLPKDESGWSHVSEVALDDFDGFQVRLINWGQSSAEIARVLHRMATR